MDRRTVVAGAIAALSFAVLMIVASSDPVQVWHDPPPPSDRPSESVNGQADELVPIEVPDTLPPEPTEVPSNDLVAAIAAGVIALLAIAVVYAFITTFVGRIRVRSRDPQRGATPRVAPLPEFAPGEVVLDVDAQLAALAEGSPRNAIVACWLRLEDDVADAGLPRQPAETSAEFTERVLGSYALDPRPIGELAALYREARFSLHELGQADRQRAIVALRQIHGALEPRRDVIVGAEAP
jgi:Domain of unknown function (DUF4129)